MALSLSKKVVSTLLRFSAIPALCLSVSPAFAQNLVENGTFDDGEYSPWWGHAAEGSEDVPDAAHTIAVIDGRMCSTITEGGENPWSVLIGLSGVALVANQHYRISFSASADVDGRPIRYKTGLGDAPYSDYYLQKINLTVAPQVFETTYLNLRENEAAQFQFQFGGTPGVVCFDDIVLEPVAAPVMPAFVSPSATGNTLKAHAALVKMGTAVDTPTFLNSPVHNSVLTGEFSMITPANSMKMGVIQAVRGEWDWAETDAMLAFADQYGMEFHGHPLVWHTQAPGWLEADDWLAEGEVERDAMIAVMYAHIDALVTRYAGRMPYWDVVNEAIEKNDAGVFGYRSTIWHDRIGPDFIDLAFIRANTLDPNAKLLYNDYNISVMGNAKADRVFDLVADMVARGIPIHQIGLQNHWYVTPDGGTEGLPDIDMIRANMARYAEIGIDVQVTESDVRIGKPNDAMKTEMQAKVYADILQVCIDAPNCHHFTLWGLSDMDSWVPSTFEEYDFAHIFDTNLVAKPAYQAMTKTFAQYTLDGSLIVSEDEGGCHHNPVGAGRNTLWYMGLLAMFGLSVFIRRSSKLRIRSES